MLCSYSIYGNWNPWIFLFNRPCALIIGALMRIDNKELY